MLGLLAVVTAIAIREHFGYFIGRDPCVAFLFALIGIKYLETRRLRDGTLIVCLACLLIVTPFFYSQSLLAAAAAHSRRHPAGRHAADARAAADAAAACTAAGARRSAATIKMFVQAIPLAVMLFLLFPRVVGAAVGRAGRPCRQAPACPITWRPATSASCRCPTPWRFASISTAPFRRRGNAIGAARC